MIIFSSLGDYTCLSISFKFERMYSYFLIHVYGPCALIVMMSWLSFLIPRNHTPARISLGITALLTTVTVLNMSNNSMPKVYFLHESTTFYNKATLSDSQFGFRKCH